MPTIRDSRSVEDRAMDVLVPFMTQRVDDGRLVVINNGPLAKALQGSIGDVVMTVKDKMYSAEIKAEERHTGNLFLETWSNRNLEDRNRHAEHGSNPGWLYKLKADLLLYYFLDTGDLYSMDFFKLQQWAFGAGPYGQSNVFNFPEIGQQKYSQRNDTYGRLVPIEVIKKQVGMNHYVVPYHTPGEAA